MPNGLDIYRRDDDDITAKGLFLTHTPRDSKRTLSGPMPKHIHHDSLFFFFSSFPFFRERENHHHRDGIFSDLNQKLPGGPFVCFLYSKTAGEQKYFLSKSATSSLDTLNTTL